MGDKIITIVLIDAHAVLHRAYHALPEFVSPTGEPTGGLYGTTTFVLKVVKDVKPDYLIACYDLPGATFRHDSYKEYKAGRAKADDALVSQMKSSRALYEALGIPIYDHPGFEADDMLGTIVEQLKDRKDVRVVVASGDMDTLQLVSGEQVVVYTLKRGLNDTIMYDEPGVITRYGFGPELLPDYKGLRGDPSDNIIGIAGIGEKTATELIKNFGSIESMYERLKKDEAAFLAAGIKPRIIQLLKDGEEEALFSKTLATIRRDAPITFSFPVKPWFSGFSILRNSDLRV
jgi:DNA polymerase I